MYKVAFITLSDKGARGEREDVSGRVIREMVEAAGYQVSRQLLLNDDRAKASTIPARMPWRQAGIRIFQKIKVLLSPRVWPA